MTTRSGLTTLALTAMALAAASGCGGSKGLSRAELIAKAEPLCERANHALDGAKMTAQNITRIAPEVAATERQVADELAKLTPPSSMAADWKVIVDGFRRASSGLQKVGEAARGVKPDPKVLLSTKGVSEGESELSNGQRNRAVTAIRNGFKECGKY